MTDAAQLRGREFHGSAFSREKVREVERPRQFAPMVRCTSANLPRAASCRHWRNPGRPCRETRRPIVGSSAPSSLPLSATTATDCLGSIPCRCRTARWGPVRISNSSLSSTGRRMLRAEGSGSADCVAVADRISARVVTICMLYHDCLLPAHGCRAVQAPVGETDGPRLWPWIRGATPPQGVWRVNSASGPTHGFIHRCFRVSDKRSASM